MSEQLPRSDSKHRQIEGSLILVYFFQLRYEHQSADGEAVQLPLAIRQDWRTGTHVTRDHRAQLRIVRRHEPCNLRKLRRIPGEPQNHQVWLVEGRIEREIRDQRGMTVEEDGEPIFERDEERRGGAAVRARRKGVVMAARADLERNAFQDELIAYTGAPELLLLETVSDQPASQRRGSNDCRSRQRCDFDRIAHVIGVRVWNENEIGPSEIVESNGTIRVGEPGAGNDDYAFG